MGDREDDLEIQIEEEEADSFLPRLKTPGDDKAEWPGPEHVIAFRVVDAFLEELGDNTSDSGGGPYRPKTRKQDPSSDPYEPWRGAGADDSASRGYDHGWANCLMTSGGIGLDYHTGGKQRRWGGELRHRQGDQTGGTDILDLKAAWAKLGYTLENRTGRGWAAVRTALDSQKRGVMLQGTGNVPGEGTYKGPHAVYVQPERRKDSAGNVERLICDPLVAGWQWVNDKALKEWAERLNSGVQFAVTRSRA